MSNCLLSRTCRGVTRWPFFYFGKPRLLLHHKCKNNLDYTLPTSNGMLQGIENCKTSQNDFSTFHFGTYFATQKVYKLCLLPLVRRLTLAEMDKPKPFSTSKVYLVVQKRKWKNSRVTLTLCVVGGANNGFDIFYYHLKCLFYNGRIAAILAP